MTPLQTVLENVLRETKTDFPDVSELARSVRCAELMAVSELLSFGFAALTGEPKSDFHHRQPAHELVERAAALFSETAATLSERQEQVPPRPPALPDYVCAEIRAEVEAKELLRQRIEKRGREECQALEVVAREMTQCITKSLQSLMRLKSSKGARAGEILKEGRLYAWQLASMAHRWFVWSQTDILSRPPERFGWNPTDPNGRDFALLLRRVSRLRVDACELNALLGRVRQAARVEAALSLLSSRVRFSAL